jgi:hypothetical protein
MASVIDALAPLPQVTHFPVPSATQASGLGTPSVTFEGPTITGIPMPGQWLLVEATRHYGWEAQIGSYLTGAVLVPKGDPLMSIKYMVRIWEDGTAAAWDGIVKTILKKPVLALTGASGIVAANLSAAALGISDPALKQLGVTTVVVKSVGALLNPLVTSGGKGPWTTHVEFLEFRKPIPALPIPDQTIPDPGAVSPSNANMVTQAGANMTAGSNGLQAGAARSLLNH